MSKLLNMLFSYLVEPATSLENCLTFWQEFLFHWHKDNQRDEKKKNSLILIFITTNAQ